ncbi:hypothetical protein [Actinocorallia longicatena]|uniref:Uncharacterized protein n=1 Tax=Actinocorallia longicatena TaxID=111803 RepID=A0ABP6PYF5_9ACTN
MELPQRISVGYAPLVALYQLLDARAHEPGRPAERTDWAARLTALRVLREGATPGDADALVTALLDPADRDVRHVAVSTRPERLGDLVAEALRFGERVLLFADPGRVPAGLLAVDGLLRPVGARWEEELRSLRHDLLILDQGPADRAALRSVEAGNANRTTVDAALTERLRVGIVQAEAEVERTAGAAEAAVAAQIAAFEEEKDATAEAARCLTVFTEARDLADGAARKAEAAVTTANGSAARCRDLEQRIAGARNEISRARQVEADLEQRLEQARGALPGATAEAERLKEAANEAEALRHHTVYRVASAESALAAERKKQNWGQRLHVTQANPEIRAKRDDLAQKRREAEQAVERAVLLDEQRRLAEGERAGMAAFLESGGRDLAAAQEAQRRHTEEIPALENELSLARTDHATHAGLATEAVAAANRAAEPAEEARRTGIAAEAALTRARAALEAAKAATERLKGEEEQAVARLGEAETALTEQEERAAAAAENGRADLAAAMETVERSGERIAAILGEEAEPEFRERAARRMELLTADPAAAASVICTTPDAVPPGPYDVLIVDRAERITDGDLLLGAVHARRCVLVGKPGAEGPGVDPGFNDLLEALSALQAAGSGGRTQIVGSESYGPSVKAEVERLRSTGLWDGYYAELHGKIVRRLNGLGLVADDALATAVSERLTTSAFQRCLDIGT